MKKTSNLETYKGLLISFVIAALAVALIVLPNQFRSEAGSQKKQVKNGLVDRNETQTDGLENYDIRENKSEATANDLAKFRQESGKTASAIADVKDNFVRGEENLRTRVPSLKVEYNQDLRIPEVITPDVWKPKMERLSAPSSGEKNSDILRNFVRQNNQLVGMERYQIDQLKVSADYTNPRGNMAFAHLEQVINGIPVFRGEIKAGFTMNGEIVRVINNLAPGLDYQNLSTDFRDPLDAVKAAADHINHNFKSTELVRNDAASSDLKVVFGTGVSATTAEKLYFPTEPGTARAAWKVLIWEPVNAYYIIVDAETGTMLWRKNITESQTESATYGVYANPNGYLNVAESPAPTTPGPIDPGLGTQGPLLTRTSVTLTGREAPNTFNNLGWMTDGTNLTDGNNVEAGVDRVLPDGVDATQPGDGTCPGAGCRSFTSTWNPPPGNPVSGDDPLTPQAQRGAVIQMFYIMNLYHDALYNLGFNEASRNFQNDNFGRGGSGNDRVSAEGQDNTVGSSCPAQPCTNNANFSTPSDGGRGRMQMYIFDGPTPDRDGTTDADVIIHEVTHGTSNRLHSNANGLTINMARGMGEGWSDFYAHTLLAEPADPADGIYTTGAYVTFNSFGLGTTNSYYGIRRFPKARLAFTGGPNNRPHNPLTFADLNAGCNINDGAFAPGFTGTCDQVHNAGEVWSSHLWEVRDLMITRLGFTAGTERVLQVVTDGMKLDPVNPTFIQARDSIIAAAGAITLAPEASADVADVREGFRKRGMGFSAVVNATSPANVTEAFDFPNVQHVDPFSVSDSTGDNDGFPEPGENVLLSVAVRNTTGSTITNVNVNANGGSNVSYGNISDGQTVTMQIPYTVSGSTACGAFEQVQINVSSDAGTQTPVSRSFRVGVPVGGAPQTFSNTTPIDLPAGQPGTTNGPGGVYPSTIAVSGLSGSKIIKVKLNSISHTYPDDLDFLLEGPGGQKYIFLSDAGSSQDLSNDNVTIWDGATEVAPDGTGLTTGEFKPANYGANDAFVSPAPAPPYANAQTGGSDTFLSVFGMNASAFNGDWKLYVVDDAGQDSGVMSGGWSITFESDDYTCGPPVAAPADGRADFDGDGRTDKSVFRPSEGNWYIDGSTDGFSTIKWGVSGDTLVPGDYDGDGKDDTAIFRPSDTPGVTDFYILNSNGFVVSAIEWGITTDIPVIGDYDGDNKDDVAIFRSSSATWYILNSSGGITVTPFGSSTDIPTVGDFDGDNKDDITTFNNGTWTSQLSSGGTRVRNAGASGDILASADYDGDGMTDQATFRQSNGTWYVWLSDANNIFVVPFGQSTDLPVPGDYDGDGTDDFAVYRNGTWWINSSQSGATNASAFGLSSDIPVVGKANP